MKIIARFAVRKDEGAKKLLILGLTFTNKGLNPGSLYEIREILDELVIVKVGESDANWMRDANSLIEDGTHLRVRGESNKP